MSIYHSRPRRSIESTRSAAGTKRKHKPPYEAKLDHEETAMESRRESGKIGVYEWRRFTTKQEQTGNRCTTVAAHLGSHKNQ
ncbi:unnamed protein product, partial [Amoebophrya sp. A120]|eukprot:GSA120T00001718001.1